jgi:hypothetical protein
VAVIVFGNNKELKSQVETNTEQLGVFPFMHKLGIWRQV